MLISRWSPQLSKAESKWVEFIISSYQFMFALSCTVQEVSQRILYVYGLDGNIVEGVKAPIVMENVILVTKGCVICG